MSGAAFLLLTAIGLASGVAPAPMHRGEPAFARAELAPADVRLFLHVEGGADLRQELAKHPLGAELGAMLADPAIFQAWHELASSLGVREEHLFDRLLGRDATFLVRGAGASMEWAVVSKVPAEEVAALSRSLSPRVLGGGRELLVSQGIELIVGKGLLIAGPAHRMGLAREVRSLLGGKGGPCLTNEPALAHARGMVGDGVRAELFLRHPAPLGGHSAAVAELRRSHRGEAELRVRCHATFERSPLPPRPVGCALDTSMLACFEGSSTFAMMAPGADGLSASLLLEVAPELVGADLLAGLRPTQTIVLMGREPEGQAAGEEARAGGEQGAPMAIVLEVADPMNVELQERRLRDRLARSAPGRDRERSGADEPRLFRTASATAGQGDRAVGAESAAGPGDADEFDGETDELDTSLAAVSRVDGMMSSCVAGPGGSFRILSNDGEYLRRIADELRKPRPFHPELGPWTVAGMMRGVELARQLRDMAGLLESGGRGDGQAPQGRQGAGDLGLRSPDALAAASGPLAAAMLRLAELTEGLARLRWRVAQPDDDQVWIELSVNLAPAADAKR